VEIDIEGKSHIEVAIEEQLFFADYKPHLLWLTTFGSQFPLLMDVAVRLLSMLTHSCDVERNCKIQKIVKTKTCNKLLNKNVFKLAYCYSNLRLLKKMDGKWMLIMT